MRRDGVVDIPGWEVGLEVEYSTRFGDGRLSERGWVHA